MTADKTHQTKPPSQDRHENRQERRVPANHHRPDFACSVCPVGAAAGVDVDSSSRCGVVFLFLFFFLCVPNHKSIGRVTLAMRGTTGDTIKLRSDGDGSRKRGVSYGYFASQISQDSSFFQVVSS